MSDTRQLTRFGQGLGLIRIYDERDNNYLAIERDPIIRPLMAGADPRELDIPLTAVAMTALERGRFHAQLRNLVDQDGFPYCVGAMWEHFLRASPLVTTLGPSWQEIYLAAQKIDGYPDQLPGTTVRAGAEVLRAKGHLEGYYWLKSVDEIRLAILTGRGTVQMGTDWWTGMADFRGIEATITGVIEGGHAWLISGWDDKRDAARISNSHGLGWGDKGRKWIKRNALERLMSDGADACFAVEKRIGAAARRQREAFITELAAKGDRTKYDRYINI